MHPRILGILAILVVVIVAIAMMSCANSESYDSKNKHLYVGGYLSDSAKVILYHPRNDTARLEIWSMEDWTKFPRQYDSRLPDGAIYYQVKIFGKVEKLVIANSCTAMVKQWGYGYVKLFFPTLGNGKYQHPTGPYQTLFGVKTPAPDSTKNWVWIWKPNQQGWKSGSMVEVK